MHLTNLKEIIFMMSIERFIEDQEVAINCIHVVDDMEVKYNMVISESTFNLVIDHIKNKKRTELKINEGDSMRYRLDYTGNGEYDLHRIYRNGLQNFIPIDRSILKTV